MKQQKLKKQNRIVYYSDLENDDFQNTKTNKHINIDGDYQYISKSWLVRFWQAILYFFVLPLLWIFVFLFNKTKVVGRKNLKHIKKKGFIIYANHTHAFDAFLGPICVAYPKRTFVISNKEALEINGISWLVKSLGVLPVPDTSSALKNLNVAVTKILAKNKALTIFPEAHIWPYFTGIRPFKATSFKFAVKNDVPCVPVAVCYVKPKGKNWQNKKPKQKIFIGEPILPKNDLSFLENAVYLRDRTFDFIQSKIDDKNNYAFITYKLKEK